ncbi:MAG: hypothetical protein PHH84_09000 [Oscillospiraceae bacterium]|nr:hypothetical protein [Oscillospiraceae bacterium]MDD4414974.1 hypothetical protein [Oscillospiraceae bacterium]
MREGNYKLGLSDLLDQSLSCYEYFYSLPKNLQDDIKNRDFGSFEDIQDYVASRGRGRTNNEQTKQEAKF